MKKNPQRKTLSLSKETIAALTGSGPYLLTAASIGPNPESALEACMPTSINTSG